MGALSDGYLRVRVNTRVKVRARPVSFKGPGKSVPRASRLGPSEGEREKKLNSRSIVIWSAVPSAPLVFSNSDTGC